LYFTFLNDQFIAFKTLGECCRYVLMTKDIELPNAEDPVSYSRKALGGELQIYNLSAAFQLISQSEDGKAQMLAQSFSSAVDNFYK